MVKEVQQRVRVRRCFFCDLQQEVKYMGQPEDILAVRDREALMGLRRVMGSSLGVGVQSQVTARWCAENGVQPVTRGDVINTI